MSDSIVTRRSFMAAAAGVGGVFLASGWVETAQAAERRFAKVAQGGRARYKALSVEDADDLIVLTEQIMPTDETPGAREAGVVFFVDESLVRAKDNKQLKTDLQAMLTTINSEAAKRYPGKGRAAKLTLNEQHALVEWLTKEHGNHFGLLKGMTAAGMFAMPSRGGNRNKAGWKLIGFKDQFSWASPYGWYDTKGNS